MVCCNFQTHATSGDFSSLPAGNVDMAGAGERLKTLIRSSKAVSPITAPLRSLINTQRTTVLVKATGLEAIPWYSTASSFFLCDNRQTYPLLASRVEPDCPTEHCLKSNEALSDYWVVGSDLREWLTLVQHQGLIVNQRRAAKSVRVLRLP